MIGKNIFVLRGNVTGKPTLRYTPDKIPVVTFGIAENYSIRLQGGWESKVRFHDVVAFNFVADRAAKYLDKGYAIECEGRIVPQTIEDKMSGKRYRTFRLVVDKYSILARPKRDAEQPDRLETNETPLHEEYEEEEEEIQEYNEDERDHGGDEEMSFDEFIIYDVATLQREMAARNPAYYQ